MDHGIYTHSRENLVDTVVRRKINFMCLQETKWTSENARELENSRFKLWYTEKVRSRNEVGIIVDKSGKKILWMSKSRRLNHSLEICSGTRHL